MSPSRMKIAKAIAFLIVVALTGCTSEQTSDVSKPPATGSSQNESPAPSGSTPPAAESPDKSTAPAASVPSAANSQIQTRLTDFQWIDGKTGYAWGTTDDHLRIYRTDDGGKSWTNVTPKGGDITSGSFQKGRNLIFLDANHGWIGASMLNGPAMVYRTTNGGRDWTKVSLDKPTFPAAIAFSSPNNGWLLTSSDAVMGSTEKSLYSTQDGGATWKLVTQTEFTNAGPNPRTGALPLQGTAQGLAFTDSNNGWLSLMSPAEVPILYRTNNSGKTWTKVNLEVLKDRGDAPMSLSGMPVFFSQEKGRGWLPVRTSTVDKPTIDAYATSDGGENWTFTALGLQDKVFFLDSKQGWGWRNGILVHTTDSGKTWKSLPVKGILADKLKIYPVPLEMQFVSSQTGWLLVGSEDGKKSLLLKTTDEGMSWTVE